MKPAMKPAMQPAVQSAISSAVWLESRRLKICGSSKPDMTTQHSPNLPVSNDQSVAACRATLLHELAPTLRLRTIRSFVLRTGRTTAGQAKAFESTGPLALVSYAPKAIDLEAVFKRRAPTVLEIGFGMGEATAQIAASLPGTNFLCCEVHTPGVGALLKRIEEQSLANIRIVQHDAVEVIDHMLALNSLDGIHIFFPDPWHKKKHNKRRLIQAPLVAKLAARLKPGGYLHCATDWQPYAAQILDVLSAEPLLVNTAFETALDGYAPKPDYRPLTKFENRGIKLGHGVWDVVFKRQTTLNDPRSPLPLGEAHPGSPLPLGEAHPGSPLPLGEAHPKSPLPLGEG